MGQLEPPEPWSEAGFLYHQDQTSMSRTQKLQRESQVFGLHVGPCFLSRLSFRTSWLLEKWIRIWAEWTVCLKLLGTDGLTWTSTFTIILEERPQASARVSPTSGLHIMADSSVFKAHDPLVTVKSWLVSESAGAMCTRGLQETGDRWRGESSGIERETRDLDEFMLSSLLVSSEQEHRYHELERSPLEESGFVDCGPGRTIQSAAKGRLRCRADGTCGLNFGWCSGVLDEARTVVVGPNGSADVAAQCCGHGSTLLGRHGTGNKEKKKRLFYNFLIQLCIIY